MRTLFWKIIGKIFYNLSGWAERFSYWTDRIKVAAYIKEKNK
jgi:hypothetical protein